MRVSSAHIAGVGSSQRNTVGKAAISAVTKALLDAGVTFSDVDLNNTGFLENERIPTSIFQIFGNEGAAIAQADSHSAFFTAAQSVRSRAANCALVVAVDSVAGSESIKKITVVAIVLVSDLFLTTRAYLRDGAVRILALSIGSLAQHQVAGGSNHFRTQRSVVQSALRQADLSASDVQAAQIQQESGQDVGQILGGRSSGQSQSAKSLQLPSGSAGLAGVMELVYQLRGWAHDRPLLKIQNALQFASSSSGTQSLLILTRSDGQPAPAWEDVKNVREGRERLGYNPAVEARDITSEDVEAVRARRGYVQDDVVKRLRLPDKGGDRAALARL